MANQSTTTFLTGSTGFIGQYVLRGLLHGGQRVVVLLRGPLAQSRLRLAALLAPLDVDVAQYIHEGRLAIMEGTLPDALPAVTVGRVDRIVHSAACLQTVNADEGEPFATNVEGVKTLAAGSRSTATAPCFSKRRASVFDEAMPILASNAGM